MVGVAARPTAYAWRTQRDRLQDRHDSRSPSGGTGHLLYYYHTPTAQSRRLLEEYFAAHPGVAERNAAPKFRERTQFTPHSLCNLLAERAGRLRIEHSDINLFLKPVASRPDYLTVRLARADRRADLRLGCIRLTRQGFACPTERI